MDSSILSNFPPTNRPRITVADPRISLLPEYNPNGATNGWVAVVLDVTERKQAEEARLSHAAIIESSYDAIIARMWMRSSLVGMRVRNSCSGMPRRKSWDNRLLFSSPPELRDEENRILEWLRAGRRIERYDTQRLTKAGNRIDVSLIIGSVRDSTGRIVGFSNIAHDITQRKRAEKALQESEQRFRLVADTVTP